MFKRGLLAIENYIKYITNIGNKSVAERAIMSFERFSLEKHCGYNYAISPVVGDVWWIDYGDNLMPEMSYNHMGIIIAKKGKSFLAIPITTRRHDKIIHTNAYHPIDNPSGKTDYFLMKSTDFSFLDHDSVAKCCELRTVSVKRIYSKVYHFDNDSSFFINLVDILHRNFFAPYDFKLKLLTKENSLFKMKILLSNLKPEYEIKDLTELELKLSISPEYIIHLTTLTEDDSEKIECVVELSDQYKQTTSRKIICIFNQ